MNLFLYTIAIISFASNVFAFPTTKAAYFPVVKAAADNFYFPDVKTPRAQAIDDRGDFHEDQRINEQEENADQGNDVKGKHVKGIYVQGSDGSLRSESPRGSFGGSAHNNGSSAGSFTGESSGGSSGKSSIHETSGQTSGESSSFSETQDLFGSSSSSSSLASAGSSSSASKLYRPEK
jgi:hypothetical protein